MASSTATGRRHGSRHHLHGQADMEVVHLVVEGVHQRCRHGLTLGVAVGGGPPHVDGHLAHPLHQAPAPAPRVRPPRPRAARRATCSARSPLRSRSGEHPDHGDQEPQVFGRRDPATLAAAGSAARSRDRGCPPPRPGRPSPWPPRGHRRAGRQWPRTPIRRPERTAEGPSGRSGRVHPPSSITVLPPFAALPVGPGGPAPSPAPDLRYPWPPLASRSRRPRDPGARAPRI